MKSLLIAILCFTTLAACSGETSPAGGATTPTRSAAPKRPDPEFDTGQTIYITNKGFEPRLLVAIVDQEITWINETNHDRFLMFDNETVKSGRIPPGGSFLFTPDVAVSITYHALRGSDANGAIQVEPSEPAGGE